MKYFQRNSETRLKILIILREHIQYQYCKNCKNKIYTSGGRWYHTGSCNESCENRKTKAAAAS